MKYFILKNIMEVYVLMPIHINTLLNELKHLQLNKIMILNF